MNTDIVPFSWMMRKLLNQAVEWGIEKNNMIGVSLLSRA